MRYLPRTALREGLGGHHVTLRGVRYWGIDLLGDFHQALNERGQYSVCLLVGPRFLGVWIYYRSLRIRSAFSEREEKKHLFRQYMYW